MAEESENRSSEDLTEEASPQRIEEYRRKGITAQSREVSGLLALVAAIVTTYIVSPRFGAQLTEFMREVFRTDLSSRMNLGSTQIVGNYFIKSLWLMFSVGFPICIAGFIVGALGSFLQIGSIFSWEPLTPDLEKLNPLQGLQRLFSLKQGVEALRLILKMIVVLSVAYFLVKKEILISAIYFGGEAGTLISSYAQIGKGIIAGLLLVLGLFAAVDFGLQKFEFQKKLRMTKAEAKQEHKDREGNPQIRSRIRAVQREMARKRMMQAVKKAHVVVTNPTHIAVALMYDTTTMGAPKVVAKGADFVAQKIKQIAAEANIPMVENVPLARTLFKTVKIGQDIPRALYQAVAEVLAYVYRLNRRSR